jgi:putative hemolysin
MNWFTELSIISLLILMNGLLAMSEIAVVSSRKTLLKKRADEGSKNAKIALGLADNPDKFLSCVQFGITLIGISAGAFGGVTLSDEIARLLSKIPFLQAHADTIAIAVVVGAITYLSIIVGELVPKRIALLNPEATATVIARPMSVLARLAKPAVWLFTASTNAVLRLIGLDRGHKTPPSEEEVSCLMDEGTNAGVFHKSERHMVEGVLRLDACPVIEIMTHRTKIVWLNIDDPDDVNWRKIVTSGRSHFPVYEGHQDNVIGMVSVKSLWVNIAAGVSGNIRVNLEKPLFVPNTISAVQVLEIFRNTRAQRALVADEFGGVQGIVSLIDVMTAIVGKLPDEGPGTPPDAVRQDDGAWLVDGSMPVGEFRRRFSLPELPGENETNFVTLGGFVADMMGYIPREGSSFEWNGWRFEVIAMDNHRVNKILMRQTAPKA